MVNSDVFALSHASKHVSCARTCLKYVRASTASFSGFSCCKMLLMMKATIFPTFFVDQFLNIVVISWKLCVSPVMVYKKEWYLDVFGMVLALLKIFTMVSVRFLSCSCSVVVVS